MNRRKFLASTVAGAVVMEFAYEWLKAPEAAGFELATAYGDWVESFIEKVDPPLASEIVFFDPGSMRLKNFKVPFRVHMLVQNPKQREQLVMVSKWGRQIASFDRARGKITKVKELPEGRRFFGHAAWDSEAGGFWVTEQDDKKIAGRLTLRGPDLEVIREYSSFGIFPHEIRMIEPGVLLAANSGDYFKRYLDGSVPLDRRISNLSWIDTHSGSLKNQVRFPKILGTAGASHFMPVPGTDLIFVGTMSALTEQPTTVLRVDKDQVTQLAGDPNGEESYRGEVVSFAMADHNQRVMWTHSKARGVFSSTLAEGAKARLVIPASSRGIASVDGDVIVAHANKQLLLRLRDGEVVQKTLGPDLAGHRWGSHLVKLDPV